MRRKARRAARCAGFALLVCVAFGLHAQERPEFFDRYANVIPPGGYDPAKRYPLVVVLPYTTGTSEEFYRRYAAGFPNRDVIYLLPSGRPQSADYLPHFTQFVTWYEERLFEDLLFALESYSIDYSRIILVGYSLGGDLSWALLARNADIFTGAVVMGSRTSYPIDADALAILAERGARVSLTIGSDEAAVRYDGINRTHDALRRAGVATRYVEIPGGHDNPPERAYHSALEWVLALF